MRCCPAEVKHIGRWWSGSSSSMPNSTQGYPTCRAWMRLLVQFITPLLQTPPASGKVSYIWIENVTFSHWVLILSLASLFRACWSRYIFLFHQLDVREQRQLHQESRWLPVWHHLQDGECVFYAQRQRSWAVSQAGKVMSSFILHFRQHLKSAAALGGYRRCWWWVRRDV